MRFLTLTAVLAIFAALCLGQTPSMVLQTNAQYTPEQIEAMQKIVNATDQPKPKRPVPAPGVWHKFGEDAQSLEQADREPLCSATGNDEDVPDPPKDKHGTINDAVTRRNYVSGTIFNPTGVLIKKVVGGGRTLVRNLCPGDAVNVNLERSFFSKKKPHVVQLLGVGANREYFPSPPLSLDESTGFNWVIGENDSELMTTWEHNIVRSANKEGFDPDIERQNRQHAQRAGVPGRVVAEQANGGFQENPYAYNNYNTSGVRAGGAIYSGNGEVIPVGVGTYVRGYNPFFPNSRPYNGECGTIFAPATWDTINPCGGRRVIYGRQPVRRGFFGNLRASFGFGF